ncbi:MAG: hypothetical protein M3P18_05030 [Actinomycetota bacterium]|nr:hypothetical protein [Actinomycetota bacterium]
MTSTSAEPTDGEPRERSKRSGHTIKGITSPEFDGETLPSLRPHLKFWKNEKRSAGRVEEMAREDPKFAGRTRADYVRMNEAEIAAREAR